jgi:hypothetical protein
MSESYKVLIDESAFISFLNRLGDIYPNETYFINTAFRSKKLTEKEKSKLGTRNREVYLSKYIRGSDNNRVDEESAIQKMYELEVPYKALTFNKGTEEEITLPQSAMVTFICCNPSIEEKVAILHLESTNDILKNLVMSCDNGAEAKKQLAHHNKDFRSERMKCNRTKWVDFDIDIENLEELNREDIKSTISYCFKNHATFNDINGMIVSTSGGFHVLVDKNCIKGNPHNFCTYLDITLSQMKCKIKEIEFKSGCCMIPCVGTLQYGNFEVTYEEL